MKTLVGNKIKELRERENLSQDELGAILGVSGKTVSSWEINRTEPKMGLIQQISMYFKVSTDYMISGQLDEDEQIYQQLDMSFIKVPLYDSISCGTGGFVDDNIIDYVSVPDSNLNPHKEYFAQKAKGDSMVNAGILEDTICVFEKASTIEDGKIGCFCIDDGIATCKKFKKGPSFIQLLPMNNNYDPIVIDLHDMNFRVLGVLKTSIKNWE